MITQTLNWLESAFKVDIRYFLKGNFWLNFSRGLSILTGLTLTTILANVLSPATYGFFDYILAISSTIGAFSLTGLGTATLNAVARGDDGVLRETFKKAFCWALIGSSVAITIGIYYIFKDNYELGLCMFIIAICIPITSSTGNYKAYLQGKGYFKETALYNIPRTLLPIISLIVTVFLTKNPVIMVAVYFITSAIASLIIYWHILVKYNIPKTCVDLETTLNFAKQTSLTSFLSQLISRIDQIFVWTFSGAQDLALYSIAISPVEELRNIPANILAVASPKLAVREHSLMRALAITRMKQMFLVVIPLMLAYITLVPFLFKILFPQYIAAVTLSQIYAFILLLQPLNFVDAVLIAKEDIKIRRFIVLTNQITKIVFLAFGIKAFGIIGGVGALILSDLVNFTMMFIVLKKRI